MHFLTLEQQEVVNHETITSMKVELSQDCVYSLEIRLNPNPNPNKVKTYHTEQYLNTAKD